MAFITGIRFHLLNRLKLPILDEILSSATLTKEEAKDEEAREMVATELLGPESLFARLLHLNGKQTTPHQASIPIMYK